MKILITGHCGFIGSQTWSFLKSQGHELYGIDNLSRSTSKYIPSPNSILADINDISKIEILDCEFDWVIHLAAQVSVTESISNPNTDFETNAMGSFKVLQWAKDRNCSIIYASTNKVFGDLEGQVLPIKDGHPLNPKTNYGISKCVGANYVADYEKGWVLHQSCIYGERQVGDVNQGWIGWIRQQIIKQENIICYGDGTQIRDLLHVEDLVYLYWLILEEKITKGSYVVGGGLENAFSFTEVVAEFKGEIARYEQWRDNDQKFFVSANSGLNSQGWFPKISFRSKISNLLA